MKQTSVERERRNRIRVAVAAYAYEVLDEPVMSDGDFDKLCLLIDPEIITGNRKMDAFFRIEFDPSTGAWVRSHPDQDGLARILKEVFGVPRPVRRRRRMEDLI